MRFALLIPAKNEEKNIPFVLPDIPEQINEIYLIDGQSDDHTVKVAKDIMPEINIILQKNVKGKGAAIIESLDKIQSDYLIIIDADGSMNPKEIPRYIKKAKEGYDLVKGSRFKEGGGTSDMTFLRKFGNFIFVTLVNLLYRKKFTDLCYGFICVNKKKLEKLNLKSDGFSIETEIIIKSLKKNYKIAEVPSFEEDRIHGSSNLHTFRDGWSILKTIFKYKFKNGK